MSTFYENYLLCPLLQKKNVTTLIDAKRKSMQLMMRKPLYSFINLYVSMTSLLLRMSFCGKMQHARELWSVLAIFDVFELTKKVSAKYTPSGIIITNFKLCSMDCKAMKGDYNQGIKARTSV